MVSGSAVRTKGVPLRSNDAPEQVANPLAYNAITPSASAIVNVPTSWETTSGPSAGFATWNSASAWPNGSGSGVLAEIPQKTSFSDELLSSLVPPGTHRAPGG